MASSQSTTFPAKARNAFFVAIGSKPLATGNDAANRDPAFARLESAEAKHRPCDGLAVLCAISGMIANGETTTDAAWRWLTEIIPNGADQPRQSRLYAILSQTLESPANGPTLARLLGPLADAPDFNANRMLVTFHGSQALMGALVGFGGFSLAELWLDGVPPDQWDLSWIDKATAAVKERRHDDQDAAARFLLRLRAEQVSRLFQAPSQGAATTRPEALPALAIQRLLTHLEWEPAATLSQKEGGGVGVGDSHGVDSFFANQPDAAPAGGRERYGSFLAEHGSFLLAEWGALACMGARGQLGLRHVLDALLAIKSTGSATAEQALRWIFDHRLESSFLESGSARVASLLIKVDHAAAAEQCMLGTVAQDENELWAWLETAESFCPVDRIGEAEPPLVVFAMRAASRLPIAERWVRKMAHELVDPSWAALAVVLHSSSSPPPALPSFVAAVHRAIEQQALSRAVRETEKASALGDARPGLSPAPPASRPAIRL